MPRILFIVVLLALGFAAHAADDRALRPSAIAPTPSPTPSGSALVARYCTQCHGMPVPNQLPKEAWPELIHQMTGLIRAWPNAGTHAAKTLAERELWSPAEGEAMLRYFVENAPSEAQIRSSIQKPAAIALSDSEFKATAVGLPRGHFLTMLHYDSRNRLMLLGLGQTILDQGELKLLNANAFAVMSPEGSMRSLTKHPTPPIHVDLRRDSFRLTLIGDMAEDTGEGEIIEFSTKLPTKLSTERGKFAQTSLLRELPRPVGSRTADFDGDGIEDLLVSGFGGNRGTGETAIYWGSATSPVQTKQILFPASGSLDGEVADFDGDGRLDILLLIAQRTQALRLYLNRGGRRFEEQTLIQRPIGWGFMDFAVADIDADGDLDIVTVAGNNMEFNAPPLKPYHGVRVWLNNGPDDREKRDAAADGRPATPSLTESYFYPLFGAGQVLVVDADGDGVLDLAATAFTPDWKEEWPETFVLLKQIPQTKGSPKTNALASRPTGTLASRPTGTLAFQPYHVAPARWRRWTYLAKGDPRPSGGSAILLGDTWLPFGAPEQIPGRLQKILDRPSWIYSLEHSPRKLPANE